ncbi:MAG TPA: hypothetical protein VMT00_12895 [Thermoanaerobaculia bacterium]|nr:hypothetical protein [Thermoanaerobaculia bacterium]
MKTSAFALVIVLLAASVPASTNPIFVSYEAARQALLEDSLGAVQKAAKEIGGAARSAGQSAIYERAAGLAESKDLAGARDAFASLSDELIKYRAAVKGDRPSVAYCPMLKKSWVQPDGEIGNPYDSSMRKCGRIESR